MLEINRTELLKQLDDNEHWDFIIIGGGATGLGCAVDAASRGFKTLLLEQSDFAKGTSSRSTKLVHGGVRYLANGDIGLVYEALRERGILLENAPHLVKKQSFVIPCYDFLSKMKYLIGLKMYDWLSGKFSFGRSVYLNKNKTVAALPGINQKGLSGGIEYYDGQFDDARLAINLAQTAVEQGGLLLNYIKVTSIERNEKSQVCGVSAVDCETGLEFSLKAKVVINATGVFVDEVLKMESPEGKPLVRPSQGVHLVLERSFLKGDSALMIPRTADGRVLFVVPWHKHLIVGTTDTPLSENSLEPTALQDEIDFILNTAGQFLEKAPTKKDILSVFAGLRPLAAPDKDTNKTKEISRSHKLIINKSGLITITGGKWTTYRKMAMDVIDKGIEIGKLKTVKCSTKSLKIHGYSKIETGSHLDIYGSDAQAIKNLQESHPSLNIRLHPLFPYTAAEVVWVVRNEMARTLEDVLARRLRVLFLNASAAIEMASKVASIMASELNFDDEWEYSQVQSFNRLASKYLGTQLIELDISAVDDVN